MGEVQAAIYGDRHAHVYDRLYGSRFASDAAVAVLATAANGGPLLEMGIGTGRLAIPLAARGVEVDGIEASAAMIEQLRARVGTENIGIFQADLAEFDLPRRDYSVAVCAVSTLFMLNGPQAQQACMRSAAAHLRLGGLLFIEAFRPDPSRFDADGHRVEGRPTSDGSTHLVHSQHDPARQRITITHVLSDCSEYGEYTVELCYSTEEQLAAMATVAGLELTARWHDWSSELATEDSRDPISVFRKTQGAKVVR